MTEYLDMSENQIERKRQLREQNDEIIPFEELSVLFLDYLKSQQSSMIFQKSYLILKQLKQFMVGMLMYFVVVTILCSCAIYYEKDVFLSCSFGGLMNSLFCIHLCVCIKKQKKYICKKSTMTRKLILLYLIEEIKEGINQDRIRLYLYDQNISVKLNWKLFIREILEYQIGIPLYLVFSYVLMTIGPTQYIVQLLRQQININYLSLIAAILVLSVILLLLLTIIGLSIFGLYKLLSMFLLALFRFVISVPFFWLYCLRYWQKKQVLKNRLQQFQRVRDIENEQCSICLLNMENAVELNCEHRFHDQCLREWLEGHNNCPICRIQV